MSRSPTTTILALLSMAAGAALASTGDRDPEFQRCLWEDPVILAASAAVQGTRYDESSVRAAVYACVMRVSRARLSRGLPLLQYYGHWPYLRLLGMQEPAACVLSLGNIVPHMAFAFYNNNSGGRLRGDALRPWLLLYPWVHGLAWLCSALYHQHKIRASTLLDYSAAFALIAFSALVALRKLLLDLRAPLALAHISIIVFLVSGAAYVVAMLSGRVSHSQHMAVCVPLTALHGLLWLGWLAAGCGRSRASRTLCLASNAWLAGAALFEVFDFAPLGFVIDAHALWHGLTIPLSVLWYRFWLLEHCCDTDEGAEVSCPQTISIATATTHAETSSNNNNSKKNS